MGRGLSAILPRTVEDMDGFRDLAVELISPNPDQPRTEFEPEALLALSESIKAKGILQPIVVRPVAGGTFELIAGERRLRAAAMAGLERVPAIVRDAADSERLELALIENVAREDLNPVEEARACATLVEDLQITKEEVGRRIGKSRVAVSNLIRLLGLPDEVLERIETGELSEGHGRAILMTKETRTRKTLARKAAEKGWSVRETERHAKEAAGTPAPPRAAGGPIVLHPDLEESIGLAEDALTSALGREVRVRSRGGRVRAEIDFDDPREIVRLAEALMRRAA
ncbi:MAG: ParB/RepB/Spo0J family partition protein [Thermoleophilaceae bacterium]|nr:ParB/RepB/Spo0J family partition protein [Thermoleophilaceae bacterium]